MGVESAPGDPMRGATEVVEAATRAGVPIRLLGGLAVRLLTPDFPPRTRGDQDMDFASVSAQKGAVLEFFDQQGFQGDKRFNLMHGHRQMFFTTPDGRVSIDVIMDELNMCHVLDFRDRIERMPYTLDVADLLLTKLQVVEQNEKDVHDITYLLAGFPVRAGDEPGTIGLDRVGKIVGEDWGWWRTVTGNLDRVVELLNGDLARLVPPDPPFDPVDQARQVRAQCDAAPKTLKWKLRSKVGERARWYELPEEVAH